MEKQFSYKSAIVRPPSKNFSKGLTTRSGNANYELVYQQWSNYCSALSKVGVHLTVLPAEDKYPDSCFVEDVAVILKDEKIVIPTNVGNNSRQGEEIEVLKTLAKKGFSIHQGIKSPGTLDGGDVRRVGNIFYVGNSKRTNLQGIQQFTTIVEKLGYQAHSIPVNSVLHLSTGSSYLGNNVMVAIKELAPFYRSFGHDVIELSEDEGYAAGLLRINGCLFVPKLNGKSFPKILEYVRNLGYKIIELEMSEAEKQDGSLSCWSLLF